MEVPQCQITSAAQRRRGPPPRSRGAQAKSALGKSGSYGAALAAPVTEPPRFWPTERLATEQTSTGLRRRWPSSLPSASEASATTSKRSRPSVSCRFVGALRNVTLPRGSGIAAGQTPTSCFSHQVPHLPATDCLSGPFGASKFRRPRRLARPRLWKRPGSMALHAHHRPRKRSQRPSQRPERLCGGPSHSNDPPGIDRLPGNAELSRQLGHGSAAFESLQQRAIPSLRSLPVGALSVSHGQNQAQPSTSRTETFAQVSGPFLVAQGRGEWFGIIRLPCIVFGAGIV